MSDTMMRSLVEAFFESKKTEVMAQLRASLEPLVEDFYEESVAVMKRQLLDPLTNTCNDKSSFAQPQQPQSLLDQKYEDTPRLPQDHHLRKAVPRKFFAIKSKPNKETSSNVLCVEAPKPTYDDQAHQSIIELNVNQQNTITAMKLKSNDENNFRKHSTPYGSAAAVEAITESNVKNIGKTNQETLINFGNDTELVRPRKYMCTYEQCNRSYLSSNHLRAHERSHTNTKPFKCKWPRCSFAAATRWNTIRHIRDVHFRRSGNSEIADLGDISAYLAIDSNN